MLINNRLDDLLAKLKREWESLKRECNVNSDDVLKVLRDKGPLTSCSIREFLSWSDKVDGPTKSPLVSAIYAAIDKLEEDELVVASGQTQDGHGFPRAIFAISPKGINHLNVLETKAQGQAPVARCG